MKLAVFGGTGKTGKHLVRQALAAGHEVRALVRTPSKMELTSERLTLVQGDVQDAAAVDETVAGTDAVLSVLGPTQNTPDYQVGKGTTNIINAMRRHGVRRLIISAGAGVTSEGDEPKLFNHLIFSALKLAVKHVLEDMSRAVKQVRNSDLDWTVVRVPMLTDDPAKGNVRVGMVGKGTGPRISREDLARFMLEQVNDTTHIRKSPVISN